MAINFCRSISKFNFCHGNVQKIILELESRLASMKEVSDNETGRLEYAIGQCKVAIEKLRRLVIAKGFPDRQSEILFFKKIKPKAYGRMLFYQSVFEMESNRTKANISVNKRYLQRRLFKIGEYMDEHHVKVQYYRCGFKHLDEQYFLRDTTEIPLELKSSHQLLDEEFLHLKILLIWLVQCTIYPGQWPLPLNVFTAL